MWHIWTQSLPDEVSLPPVISYGSCFFTSFLVPPAVDEGAGFIVVLWGLYFAAEKEAMGFFFVAEEEGFFFVAKEDDFVATNFADFVISDSGGGGGRRGGEMNKEAKED